MARHTIVQYVDDIDGTTTTDVETVKFGIDGNNYEIDLSPENAAELRTALATYIKHGRPVTTIHNRGTKVTRISSDAGTIRAWAKANDIDIPARGRIPASIRDQFAAATA